VAADILPQKAAQSATMPNLRRIDFIANIIGRAADRMKEGNLILFRIPPA
jgi:hypothetical protein